MIYLIIKEIKLNGGFTLKLVLVANHNIIIKTAVASIIFVLAKGIH